MNSARFVDIETANPTSEARGRVVIESTRRPTTESTRKIAYVEEAPAYNEEIERVFNTGRGSNYLKFPKFERHIQVPHGKGNSPPFRLKDQSESPRRNMLLKDSRTGKRYWEPEKYFEDSGNYDSDGSQYSEQIGPENYGYPDPNERGKFYSNEPLDPDGFFPHKDTVRVRHIYKEPIEHEKHLYSEASDRDGFNYKMQIEGNEHERYLKKKIMPDGYCFPEGKERSRVLFEQLHHENEYYPKGDNRERYPYGKPVEPGNHYYREADEPDEYFYSEANGPEDYQKRYYYSESDEGYVQERRIQRYPYKEQVESESYRTPFVNRFESNRDGYLRNKLVEPEKPMHHNVMRSRKLQYQEPMFTRFSPDDNSRVSSDEYPPLFPSSHENRRAIQGNFISSYDQEDQLFEDRRSNPSFLKPKSSKREYVTGYEPHKRIRKDEPYPLSRKNSEEAYGFEGYDFDEERMNYDDDSYLPYDTHMKGHDLDQIRVKPKWRTRTGQNEYAETHVDNVEVDWTPEPYESSEDFKQKVEKALLLYSKNLNISQSVRRKYLMRGKAGSLFCIVCRRGRKEFPDTESLAKHALLSRDVEQRAEHIGLHKAICLIMGWDTCLTSNPSEWEPLPLAVSEAWTRREDLILWPPIVIVRNLPFSITPPEKISAMLRGKGLINGKMNVSLGQPADQSVTLLKFLGTFTGLDSAERVNRYFSDNYRGRGKFHVRAKGGGSGKKSASEEEDVYGYLGTASDLELLDGQARKQVVIKSKKSIMDFANEPVKPNDS